MAASAAAIAARMQQRQQDDEDNLRNELFAGRADGQNGAPEPHGTGYIPGPSDGGISETPEAELTVQQLVNKANRVHKDTTTVAKRALKTVEQTKQLQEGILGELNDQSKRLEKIDDKIYEINEDITYSERLLRYMRRCCCCLFCDSCTGADPEDQIKRNWNQAVDKGETVRKAQALQNRQIPNMKGSTQLRPKANGAAFGDGETSQFRAPDIRLPEEHRQTEMAMHEETRKQDEIIDQIHNGLGNLMEGAKNIGDELGRQNKVIERIQDKTDNTSTRIDDMNNKSQLRQFRERRK